MGRKNQKKCEREDEQRTFYSYHSTSAASAGGNLWLYKVVFVSTSIFFCDMLYTRSETLTQFFCTH